MSDEEEKWRSHVDSNILYERLEDVRERVKELERIIKGKGGLISEYEKHDDKLVRLYAVIFQDPTGQKGLLHDVDVLMGRKRDKDENRGLKWKFWAAILTAMITSGALVLTKLGAIREALLKVNPLEKTIEKAKRPPRHIKTIRYRYVPAPPPSDATPNPSE